ncbi:hypothetical protein V8C44DRAFT_298073 [Trichoderma aethiopicum]
MQSRYVIYSQFVSIIWKERKPGQKQKAQAIKRNSQDIFPCVMYLSPFPPSLHSHSARLSAQPPPPPLSPSHVSDRLSQSFQPCPASSSLFCPLDPTFTLSSLFSPSFRAAGLPTYHAPTGGELAFLKIYIPDPCCTCNWTFRFPMSSVMLQQHHRHRRHSVNISHLLPYDFLTQQVYESMPCRAKSVFSQIHIRFLTALPNHFPSWHTRGYMSKPATSRWDSLPYRALIQLDLHKDSS